MGNRLRSVSETSGERAIDKLNFESVGQAFQSAAASGRLESLPQQEPLP